MSGLTRDILRWMQSLDLSFSVKNPKRDFANGFLVAEILSRYYKQEIQMHAFDNCNSTKKMKENWGVLIAFFKKTKFPIARQQIDAIIYQQENAVIPLIETIYTILTQKPVNAVRPLENDEFIPDFAKKNTLALVRDSLNVPDMLENYDDSKAAAKAKEVIEKQKEIEKLKKLGQGGDSVKSTVRNTANLRVTSRRVAKLDGGAPPQIQFKSVQVKQLDESTLKLRQQVLASTQGDGSPRGGNTERSNASDFSPRGITAEVGGGLSVLALLSSLLQQNQVLMKKLTPMKTRTSNSDDDIILFADNLDAFEDQTVASFLVNCTGVASEIAEMCLTHPKQFWLFINVISNIIHVASNDSYAIQAAVDFVSNVGAAMCSREKHVPRALLQDFALLKALNICRGNPSKVLSLSRMIMCFCPLFGDNHQNIVQGLVELAAQSNTSLPNVNVKQQQQQQQTGGKGLVLPKMTSELYVLVQLLAGMATCDNSASWDVNQLFALYLEVAKAAVGHASAAVRLAGLTLCTSLAAIRPDKVFALVKDSLARVAEGKAPEGAIEEPMDPEQADMTTLATKAQVAILFSLLINQSASSSSSSIGDNDVAGLISHLMKLAATQDNHPALMETCVVAIAGCMGRQRALRSAFCSILVSSASSSSSSTSMFDAILSRSHDLNVHDGLAVTPVTQVWDPLTVAQAVQEYVETKQLENLPAPLVLVLAKAVCSSSSAASIKDKPDLWWSWLSPLQHHLTIELVDPSICSYVGDILTRILIDGYIFLNESHEQCQTTLFQLFERASKNAAVKPHLAGILEAFIGESGVKNDQLSDLASRLTR